MEIADVRLAPEDPGAESHTSEEIADLLHIRRRTVERHRENILAKLGLTDRIQLTRYAIRRGLIDA